MITNIIYKKHYHQVHARWRIVSSDSSNTNRNILKKKNRNQTLAIKSILNLKGPKMLKERRKLIPKLQQHFCKLFIVFVIYNLPERKDRHILRT